MIPSANHEAWHTEQLYALRGAKIAPIRGVCSMVCTFYPKTKRASDLSNKFESVADLLVDAGIISDDNWFVLSEVVLRFGEVDKDNPRVTIVIDHD